MEEWNSKSKAGERKEAKKIESEEIKNRLSRQMGADKIDWKVVARECQFDALKELQESNAVHKPSHYNNGKYECIEVMREVYGKEMVDHFIICNAFKYLWRYQQKGGNQDLLKAREYLNMLELGD